MQSRNERWRLISQLFDAALERPHEERASWLAEACANQPDLRDEVERMLTAHDRTGVLDHAVEAGLATMIIENAPRAGQQLGPYRIVEELGRGGMGVVFKAYDERLNRYAALKFMTGNAGNERDGRERLLREARAASALDHPNICTIYDIGQTDHGEIFIAMAFCDGKTLAARLSDGPLALDECIHIARQIAAGLACAHQAGVIHRDIKPSNIVIGANGVVRIVDFGIAKLGAGSDADGRAGTLLYSAPEQIDTLATDARSDIWSLGVVLYEMITGKRPFTGQSEFEIIKAALNDAPEPVTNLRSGVPDYVVTAIAKALAKSPADRFATAADFADALQPVRQICNARHLPLSMTSFLGREVELERAQSLLRSARLVTFTGPAGTGKTRLAMELGLRLGAEFRDGAVFVPLAAVRQGELVLPQIIEALQLFPPGTRIGEKEALSAIRDCELLLVLDNFEQVVSAAPVVAELLTAAPRLKIAVTSRVPLKLTGEHEMPVPPLRVPWTEQPHAAVRSPAVQLFIDRARAVRHDLPLDDNSIAAISDICRRLDGLPLAIELAAARSKIFSPQALLARLGSRLDLLKSADRDRPARHQTLRQSLAWSYDLLDEREQQVFRRAGVFASGFTFEALEAVCGDRCGGILDAVSMLVDHSLFVRTEGPGGEARFSMLETMREYALELLHRHNEYTSINQAHAEWCSAMCTEAAPRLTGSSQALWLRRLDADHDNVRAALSWYERTDDIRAALRMATDVWRYWTARGHHREGRAVLDRLLARMGDDREPSLLAHAYNASGTLAHGCCEMSSAQMLLRESLRLFREIDDAQGVGLVLNNLAWIDVELSEFSTARELAEEAYRLNVRLGDKRGMAVALNNLGWIANYTARFEDARSHFEGAIALRRETGDLRGVGFGLTNLAWMEQRSGAFQRSADLIEEALDVLAEVDDALLLAWAKQQRAVLAYRTGRFLDAIADIESALPTWRLVGNSSGLAFGACYYGLCLLETGAVARAAAAFDEAETALRSLPQRWGTGIVALARARLHLAQDNPTASLGSCLYAIGILHKIGDRVTLATAYELCAKIMGGCRPAHAGRCVERARTIRTEVYGAASASV